MEILLTHTIKDKKSEAKKHEIEYNLDILKILDIYADVRAPSLDAPKEDLDYIDKVINNSGLDSKKLTVAIHIGSSNPSKVWPLENFSSLAEGIRKKIDCNIVFIGDDKDKDEAAKILLADKSLAANLCGAFSVKQLIAFLKKTDIFIGCDSGPMHIAASVGAKVIALFGNASNPLRWHPWGKGHLVLQNDDINKITPTEILAQLKS